MSTKESSTNQYIIWGVSPVGQVLAAHLDAAGHDVKFFTHLSKEKNWLKAPVQVFNYGRKSNCFIEEPKLINHEDALIQTLKEYPDTRLMLCFTLDQVSEVSETLKNLPKKCNVISFIPMVTETKNFLAHFNEANLLYGFAGFSSYQQDQKIYAKPRKRFPTLIGEFKKQPPETKHALAESIAKDLKDSGLPARYSTNFASEALQVYAATVPFFLGLEYNGWHTISVLENKGFFDLVHAAMKETALIVRMGNDLEPPLGQRVLAKMPTLLFRLILMVMVSAPDSRTYVMWAKQGKRQRQQTYELASQLCELAGQWGLSYQKLKELLKTLNQSIRPKSLESTKIDHSLHPH